MQRKKLIYNQCVYKEFTTLSISTMLEADCSHEEFCMYLEKKNQYFLKKPTQQFTVNLTTAAENLCGVMHSGTPTRERC